LPSSVNQTQVATYDKDLESMSSEAMVALGQELIDRVHNYDADILCTAKIIKTIVTIKLGNTEGARTTSTKTLLSVYLEGNLTTGTDILEIAEDFSSSRRAINAELLVSELTNKFDMAKRIATVGTKAMPVILTPKAVANAFYLPMQLAFNGRLVAQGASPLTGKDGQKMLDARISILDDGTVDWAPRSVPFDDEGIPTRQTALVQAGVIENFLYDLQTAAKAGKSSTGNGFRGLNTLPGPTPTSIILAEGDTLLADMIEDVKEGILIDQIMGAWAGNVLAGELSGNIHVGYKIENGEIVGRVKDTMISSNFYEALGTGLAAMGSEGSWVEGAMFTPPIYLNSVSIASKQA
jgi:PmbA protein